MDSATYMCEEIVIEILSRLPVKSLVRFMAVCRLWKSIITSPQFRLLSKRPTRLLVHTDRECYTLVEDDQEENRLMFETEFPIKDYSYDFHNDGVLVVGSDNGLICIDFPKESKRRYFSSRVIIWNPCIRKHVMIPDYPMDDNYTVSSYVRACGFGGTTSGDYKYVRVVELRVGENSFKHGVVEIYSVKTGTWRRKYLDWEMTCIRGKRCALLRGRLHWFSDYETQIFSFELEDEVFGDIFVVPNQSNLLKFQKLTVIRESLAVITTDDTGQHSTVWVMEEYGDVNSWIKKWTTDQEEPYMIMGNMVHLMKDGELLLGLRRIDEYRVKQKLATYNPKTTKTCDFGGGVLSSLEHVCGFTNYYKESLVLLADDYHAAPDQPTLQAARVEPEILIGVGYKFYFAGLGYFFLACVIIIFSYLGYFYY